MKAFILFIFLFFNSVHAQEAAPCTIELCKKFIILENTNTSSPLEKEGAITSTTCPENLNKKVVQFLNQTDGNLRTGMLKNYFPDITFAPNEIEIQNISKHLASHYGQAPYAVTDIRTHFHKSNLCIEDSNLSSACESCNSPGRKNVAITVRGQKINYTIPIEMTLKTKVKAYKIGKSFSANQILSATAFEQVDFLTDSPADSQVNIDQIRFYTSTRPLVIGEILKVSEIMPAILVHPGKMTKVILHSSNLQIQSEGRALQGASIGQNVQVQLNNKTVDAIATDFDELTVEL